MRPSIALFPAEYRWLEKEAIQQKTTVNEVLYHLTKEAIDRSMQREGEWCEWSHKTCPHLVLNYKERRPMRPGARILRHPQ
jgi:hypothetical protein